MNEINEIVEKIYNFLEIPIIQKNQNRPKPQKPFLGYFLTSGYINGLGEPNRLITYVESESEDFDFDVLETTQDQRQFVISFSSYGNDYNEAFNYAKKLKNYFKLQGRYELNSVIIEVGNIENRTSLIVDHYEHIAGFDVRFRLLEENEYRYETIEKVTFLKIWSELLKKWVEYNLNWDDLNRFKKLKEVDL